MRLPRQTNSRPFRMVYTKETGPFSIHDPCIARYASKRPKFSNYPAPSRSHMNVFVMLLQIRCAPKRNHIYTICHLVRSLPVPSLGSEASSSDHPLQPRNPPLPPLQTSKPSISLPQNPSHQVSLPQLPKCGAKFRL